MSSDRKLNSILDKISRLTEVLIQASEIRDALNKEQYNLKGVVDKTKNIVNILTKYTEEIKEQFCKDYPDTPPGDNKSISVKPFVKLVDISKLVEPKINTDTNQETPKEKRSVQFNTSIVIISSSDEENNKRRSIKQKEIKFDKSDKLKKTNNKITKSKKVFEDESDLSDTSSLSSEEEEPPKIIKNKKRVKKQSNSLDLSKKDIKFNSECYVKVYRIPCEKMKEFYNEKSQIRTFRRLVNNKKRILVNSSSSTSDTENEKEETLKTKPKLLKKKKTIPSPSSDSSDEHENLKNDHSLNNKKKYTTISENGNESDEKAKQALDLLEIAINGSSNKKSTNEDKNEELNGVETSDNPNNKKITQETTKERRKSEEDLLAILESGNEAEKENVSNVSKRGNLMRVNLELPLPLSSDSDKEKKQPDKDSKRSSDVDLNDNISENNKGSKKDKTVNEKDENLKENNINSDENEDNSEKKKRKKKDNSSESDNSENENKKRKTDNVKSKENDDNSDNANENKSQTENGENSETENNKESSSNDKQDKCNSNKESKDNSDNDNENKSQTENGENSDTENNKKSSSNDEQDKCNSNKESKDNIEENENSENKEPPKDESKKNSGDDGEDSDPNKNNKKKSKKDVSSSEDSDSDEEKKKKKKKNKTHSESNSENDEEKNKIISLSDTSDEDITKKKRKRVSKRIKKFIASDSGSSVDEKAASSGDEYKGSSSDSEDKTSKKRARKRIKRITNSSSEEEGGKLSRRKNIKKIIDKNALMDTTIKAEAEEKERKARILEKQKKYNQIYELGPEAKGKVDKVVLDFDEKTKKELLAVDESLVEKLKPHQASGIQFMWDACFESLERAKTTTGSGCILAHCMGLGKTLQIIALSHTLLVNYEKTGVKKVMVVCPLNTVLNWVNEYKHWLSDDDDDFEVFELVSCRNNNERYYKVKHWHENGGVLIIGYTMFRNLTKVDKSKLQKKIKNTMFQGMVDPGPDLVVCDEGHLLKNEKTNLSTSMNKIKTLRRIVLTGTPLQNNLREYFCMVQFVKPNLLGTYKEYLNRFVNPITNGQYTDSTPLDIQIMRKRSHVLHKLLDGVVQRRDYGVLQPFLPPKYEYVLFLTLTEVQTKLYKYYIENFSRLAKEGQGFKTAALMFSDFYAIQRICTHPRVLLDKSIEDKTKFDEDDYDDDGSEGSLKDFIDDDESGSTSSSGSSSDGEIKKTPTTSRRTRAAVALAKQNGEKTNDNEPIELEQTFEMQQEWWGRFCDKEDLNNILLSNKLFLLFEILKECEQIGDKILVFSQSLYSLNLIEYFLGLIDDATQRGDTTKFGGFSGSWSKGLDYFRLDGSSSCDSRNTWCKIFNNPNNTRARLFLISTKAGGLGINLVAANRVIIFDVSWNPSHDVQSIYRVYRFGQTKPCYIYRFVTYGTMEMKIYERQVVKQSISKRVLDEQQIDRHYNQNDIQELYNFEPTPENRPTPLVPKDVLLGELLQTHDTKIFKYHEHQSLLENKEEECLNEEERKAAWEEFENEKTLRVKYSNYTNIGMMNANANMGQPNYGVYSSRNDFQEAIKRILRRENPNWGEYEVNVYVPILSQKLQMDLVHRDITLYNKIQQEVRIMELQKLQELQKFTDLLKQCQNFNQPTPSTSNPTEIIDLND